MGLRGAAEVWPPRWIVTNAIIHQSESERNGRGLRRQLHPGMSSLPSEGIQMQISDFPAFVISEAGILAGEVNLTGTFTNVTGVREGRSWLLLPDSPLIGDLVDLDLSRKTARFVTPHRDAGVMPNGPPVPWLDGYWEASLVRRVADPAWVWRQIHFTATDAIEFTQNGVRGWTQIGNSIPAGGKFLRVSPKGWDHEHCAICWQKIGRGGDCLGYVDEENTWLCETCFQKFASQHDVSFARL